MAKVVTIKGVLADGIGPMKKTTPYRTPYREPPEPEPPRPFSDHLGIWWRKPRSGGNLIVALVAMIGLAGLVESGLRSSRQDKLEDLRLSQENLKLSTTQSSEKTSGCRDMVFRIEYHVLTGDPIQHSIQCARSDQRLTWNGSWVQCLCVKKDDKKAMP